MFLHKFYSFYCHFEEKRMIMNFDWLELCLKSFFELQIFQISIQNFKAQKSYRKFLGVRSELLLSIFDKILLQIFAEFIY